MRVAYYEREVAVLSLYRHPRDRDAWNVWNVPTHFLTRSWSLNGLLQRGAAGLASLDALRRLKLGPSR